MKCASWRMKMMTCLAAGALLAFNAGNAGAQQGSGTVNLHLPFEDFRFLDDEFVARSEYKTIEDRGLELVEGRYGKALTMIKEPSVVEQDEMTGIDLDTVTAVVFNTRYRRDVWVGYNEPFLWGAGRLNPGSGAVAFWVRGRVREGELFTQSAMAWGRKERYLLGITVDGLDRVGAYIEDSRYVRHEIVSEEAWNADDWNHVVLNWDKANGLSLYINGKQAASNWGTDSWWQTALPGLLHMPMPKVSYDELYVFSRPLNEKEIDGLMNKNHAPGDGEVPAYTPEERDRLAKALGLYENLDLPVASHAEGNAALRFREVTPVSMGDGNVPARFCQDGRYELAWPHPVAVFTIVPGDADFQAEKIDIVTAPGEPYNYITVEGNLVGMPAILTGARKENDHFTGAIFTEVPQDSRFFYGATLERSPHDPVTLPFLKGYGAPGEFSGNVFLPLNGQTRIHEVGLFDVTTEEVAPAPGDETFYLSRRGSLSARYGFAVDALNPLRERTVYHANRVPDKRDDHWVESGFLKRTNLITAPMPGETYVGSVLLDLELKTRSPEDILLVRLHDPGNPHRIWTHAECELKGFEEGGRLRLLLDPPPLFLAENDVIWVDIVTYNNASIRIGGPESGKIVLKAAEYSESVAAYEAKALMPVMAEHMKAYHHRPWVFEKRWPDVLDPHTFGGQYDSVVPALAVQRVLPYSRLADYYVQWAQEKYHWGSFADPEKNFPIKDIAVPAGVPRWAYLQKLIQNFRYRVIDWLAANQNPDGQIGGGWNDDTLILRGRPDTALDGSDEALNLYLRVYEGLDHTNLFGGGFCQIRPIDNVHNGDFVRERFRAVVFKPGDPYIMRRALETAWHHDKPLMTPFNFGDGKPFLFDKNILEWWWGTNMPTEPFENRDWKSLDPQLSRLASYLDDHLLHRFTEARVHTDASSIYNESYITRMILGGGADQTISVSWPDGAGETMARWVTYADDKRLECRIFSFDDQPCPLTARLYRINGGTYEIKLAEDMNGVAGRTLYTTDEKLDRFGAVTVLIPPKTPVILTVREVKKGKTSKALPDLAVAPYDCRREGSSLRVRVSNLGSGPSRGSKIRLYDASGEKIAEEDVPGLESPADFVEKSVWVEFDNVPVDGSLRVVVDFRDKMTELFEENNEAVIE